MKNTILVMVILLVSCKTGKQRVYKVHTSYGTGWDLSSSMVKCDSVKLITPKHARIYVDGVATDLFADQILVSN
jgi:hypothetical protein